MKIKILFLSLIVIPTTLLVLSCSSEDLEVEDAWVDVSVAPAEGGTINIYFTTNFEWKAKVGEDNVEIFPQSGKAGKNHIVATYPEYRSTKKRKSSSIDIYSKNGNKILFEFWIGQEMKRKFSVSKSEVNFGYEASEDSMYVISNYGISTYKVDEHSQFWLRAEIVLSDEEESVWTMLIRASENKSGPREGIITVVSDEYEEQVHVRQKGNPMYINP